MKITPCTTEDSKLMEGCVNLELQYLNDNGYVGTKLELMSEDEADTIIQYVIDKGKITLREDISYVLVSGDYLWDVAPEPLDCLLSPVLGEEPYRKNGDDYDLFIVDLVKHPVYVRGGYQDFHKYFEVVTE